MIKIEDVIVPTKGTAKYFNITALNFPMNPSSVTFYWQILSEVEQIEDELVTNKPGSSLIDGNLAMTQEEYSAWGDDDTYVINWALAKLGFVALPV
jgi:hypothetical protein